MVADGAYLGSLGANHDVSAIRTLPDAVALAAEDDGVLNVLQQAAIALFVMLFYGTHHLKLFRNLVKSFFACLACKLSVHVCPFIVFSLGGIEEVLFCAGNAAAMQQLKPDFGVLLFVGSGFFEDSGYLDVAVFLGL